MIAASDTPPAMTEHPHVSQPEPELSLEDRLALIQTLNGLPLSQLLELEFALDIPSGIMPDPTAAIGLRNRNLLDWVEGSTGIGFPRFFEILDKAVGISWADVKANSPQRLAFTIKGTINENDIEVLTKILRTLRDKVGDPSIEISSADEGSIKLNLQGSSEGLRRLQELVDLGELTEVEGKQVQSVKSFFDLSGANLRGVNLRNADLSSANLRGANLIFANLRGVTLSDANLSDANLSGTDLSGANLSDANLSGVDFSGADLSFANLSGANLSFANLIGTNLIRANLVRANCSFANLSDVNLSNARLIGADLSFTNFSDANFSDADLSIANLSSANLSRARLIGADISRADLSDAIVRQAIFANNSGLIASTQDAFQRRGAIFEDPPGSDIPTPVNR